MSLLAEFEMPQVRNGAPCKIDLTFGNIACVVCGVSVCMCVCTCVCMQPVYFQSILNYGTLALTVHAYNCLIAAVLLIAELSASVYLVYY